MDIKGAKALKERLARNGAPDDTPAPEPADLPEDTPPVYHWTGKTPVERAPLEAEDDDAPRRASLFSRLALNFR